MHATRNPDGTFTHAGRRYRLSDRADDSDTVDVIREEDHTPVGSFRILAASGSEPNIEILPGSKLPGAVHAIAALLESTRGALPLQ
jgi:hypothetical protein